MKSAVAFLLLSASVDAGILVGDYGDGNSALTSEGATVVGGDSNTVR